MSSNQKEKNKAIFSYNSPILTEQRNLAHGFFTRIGGISRLAYQSLNCNTQSSDKIENVIKNQTIICHNLGFTHSNLKMADQIHSASVIIIKDKDQQTSHLKADALVTQSSNILLGIKTADCVPILFFDNKSNTIGAAHAGWKGALSGVIGNTILAMQSLGAQINDIIATIGPCIQQPSYEVDECLHAKFIEKDCENKQFFISSNKANHYLFDLPGYCIACLKKIGIRTIDNLNIDTYSNADTLFSFRRSTHETNRLINPIECGRQLSAIGLLLNYE